MWSSEYQFYGANNSQITGLFQILLFIFQLSLSWAMFQCFHTGCECLPFLPYKWLEFIVGTPVSLSFLFRKESCVWLYLGEVVPWVMSHVKWVGGQLETDVRGETTSCWCTPGCLPAVWLCYLLSFCTSLFSELLARSCSPWRGRALNNLAVELHPAVISV